MSTYQPESNYTAPSANLSDPFTRFKIESGNSRFKTHWLTYVSTVILLLFVGQGLMGDQTHLLKSLEGNETMKILVYVFTIIFQWIICGVILLAVKMEQTGVNGIGLVKLRGIDFAWGVALLLMLFVVGLLSSLVLTALGMPPKGEVQFLLPTEWPGRILWVLVSFTAGFCEEVLFRGYIMTRIRLAGRFKSWVVPTLISALAFGFPHIYQGVPGFLTITVLGVLFSIVYIRTGSLWPCIIAHFFLDFVAIIIPFEY